ncbi:MAG: hypothetical protein ACJ79A_06635 [Gemmatimonadaceae bacterium]
MSVLGRSLPLLVLLFGVWSARVEGQITAGIATTANILSLPLTGTGTRALQFGVIVPGTTTVTVLPRTSAGAEFRIAGVKSRKSVDISFTLPTQLNGPAGDSIPLSFNGNFAGLCEIDTSGACVLASYVTWNPVSTPTFRDNPTRYQPGRKVYAFDTYQVYLGGIASPSTTQRQGTYTASIGVLLVVN